MSVMPPLNVNETNDEAECPSCGNTCLHPVYSDGSVDEDEWFCTVCDYVYPD